MVGSAHGYVHRSRESHARKHAEGCAFGNMAVPQRHQLSDHVLFEHSDKELHGIVLPDSRITAEAHISSMEQYQQMYKRSVEQPEQFWGKVAEQFHWHKPATTFLSYNFNVEKGPIFIKWMEGAQTNVCYNVLDRIITEKNGENTIAFYWLVCLVAHCWLCMLYLINKTI